MAQPQAGVPQGAEQPGVSTVQQAQMEASPPRTTRGPDQAAFGGDAAIVYRDYASI